MSMKVHQVWYVAGHVPDFTEAKTEEEALESTTLIAFNDAHAESDYIPVFKDILDCDSFVSILAEEHQDLAFAVCSFESLVEINEKIQEEFNREIRLLIQESN